VIDRSEHERGPGAPYVGSDTAYALELTGRPVLVVPAAHR
jgi:hypothetical protein